MPHKHPTNDLPLRCPYKTQMLRNIESDEKEIHAWALLVYPVIPPMPHRLPGHELFDVIAKPHSCQIRATFECRLVNRPASGGYLDV